MADGKASLGLNEKQLSFLRTAFNSETKNQLALNFGVQHDVMDLCLDRQVVETTNHVFKHKVKEVKPMTNQKSSGRCWIFALLNIMRQKFMQSKNMDEFEFSQQHLFFWDKIERSFYFLNIYVEMAKKGEEPDGRLFMFLLSNPMNDGGQWDMLVNLVEKYGVMPRAAWPESNNAGKTRRMNNILNHKHREYAMRLGKMVKQGCTDEELENGKMACMKEIFRIVSICLGCPPNSFTWEYYDKDKDYTKVENITPLQFYKEHVKPLFNIRDKICIVNDPRNPYNKMYTVEYLGNVVGGDIVRYNNQPVEVLKYLAAASLRDDEAVWFGCDVGKHFERRYGALDLKIHNYDLVFGISLLKLTKTERLVFGESLMTHAMTFTGITYEDPNEEKNKKESESSTDQGESSGDQSEKESKPAELKPIKTMKWRVENSWGDDKPDKGYLLMTDGWFDEFVFEVVVDKKYVPPGILAILDQEPVVLPAWDPMGSLACTNCNQEMSARL